MSGAWFAGWGALDEAVRGALFGVPLAVLGALLLAAALVGRVLVATRVEVRLAERRRRLLERCRTQVGQAFEANATLRERLEAERLRRHALSHLLSGEARGKTLTEARLAAAIDDLAHGGGGIPRDPDVDALFDAAREILDDRHLDLDEDAQEVADLADALSDDLDHLAPRDLRAHARELAEASRDLAANPVRLASRVLLVVGHAGTLGLAPWVLWLAGVADAPAAAIWSAGIGAGAVVAFLGRAVVWPWGTVWPTRLPDPAAYAEQRLQLLAYRHARRLDAEPPEVRIVHAPEPAVRALGTRRGPSQLVVTTGLLRTLHPDEVGPVFAHELALLGTGESRFRLGLALLRGPADAAGKALGGLLSLVVFHAVARFQTLGGRAIWRPNRGLESAVLAPVGLVLGVATGLATTWRLSFRAVGILAYPGDTLDADERAAQTSDRRQLIDAVQRIDAASRTLRVPPPTPLIGALDLIDPGRPTHDAPGFVHRALLERWLEAMIGVHPTPADRAAAITRGADPVRRRHWRGALTRLSVVVGAALLGAVIPGVIAAATWEPPAPAVIARLQPATDGSDLTAVVSENRRGMVEIVPRRGCHVRAEADVDSRPVTVLRYMERCAPAGERVGPWFPMVCGPYQGFIHRSCLPRDLERRLARHALWVDGARNTRAR